MARPIPLDYDDYADLHDAYEAPRSRKPKLKRASKNLLHGIVTRARGHHYDVRILESGVEAGPSKTRVCEVRGRLLQERGKDTLVAVGDTVWVLPEGARNGLIEQVEERRSVLSRQHPGEHVPAEDVILANPDQVLVVFAVADPEPHIRMLDRFLVVAEANELPAVVCVNKIDLRSRVAAQVIFGVYETAGYPVVYVSAQTGEGVEEVRTLLLDRITVLTGPSGVGKSRLLNALDPALDVEVGDLREFLRKGRHTTRAAQLFALPLGERTFIADTPGIRELGLYEIDPHNLGFYFREFAPHLHACRFPNCTHDHEPGCMVRSAVETGLIDAGRYESYLRLLRGEE